MEERVGAEVDAKMGVDVDMSAISSSIMSISVDSEMCGSEVGATTAAASDVEACVMDDEPRGAASAAREEVDGVGMGAEEETFLTGLVEERLVDAGRRGHARESCPTALQRGHALSDPGHEAKTLKPRMSKKGVAERVLPTAGSLRTMSQRLVDRGKPLTV